ncbi:MAG TPA: hypothetical protein VG759_05850 [Candidatus Angelobacter sp.]|nr:hypothetical protein [Candidatus Angelobacter sp.]
MKLVDQIIAPIIISVQFLFCLLCLLYVLLYGGGRDHSGLFLLLLIYFGAGFGSAVYLNSRKPRARILACIWNLSLVAFATSHGLRWEDLTRGFFGYYITYSFFVIPYLGVTAALGLTKEADSE